MMNHVGINVPNVADAVTYYTEKMGYREAFRANDAAGAPRLVYMQISRNTFLELQPGDGAAPGRLHALRARRRQCAEAVAAFKARGLTVTDVTKERHRREPRQHHRSVHGSSRARGDHAGLHAQQGDPELEMTTRPRTLESGASRKH
jgi:catechol 2,3-dioxygenase-like lactoylglutathione lyase family enzyme